MSVSITFSSKDFQLSQEQIDAIDDGALASTKGLFFQYVCSTIDGQHSADSFPDNRVRPSHAALHGTIWAVDDPNAPVPPIDWGCRCAMRYITTEDSPLADVMAQTNEEPNSMEFHFSEYLDREVNGWEDIYLSVKGRKKADQLGLLYEKVLQKGIKNPRDIARMIYMAAGN
jgi:hypothetical protein